MIGIDTPKTDRKLASYMSLSGLRKLFHFLEQDNSRMTMRNHLLFKLLATTGMRRFEIVELTWEQIDLSNNTIRIYVKKRALTPPSSYGCPFNKKLYGKFRGISAPSFPTGIFK